MPRFDDGYTNVGRLHQIHNHLENFSPLFSWSFISKHLNRHSIIVLFNSLQNVMTTHCSYVGTIGSRKSQNAQNTVVDVLSVLSPHCLHNQTCNIWHLKYLTILLELLLLNLKYSESRPIIRYIFQKFKLMSTIRWIRKYIDEKMYWLVE